MDSHQNADLVERALRTAKVLRGQVPGRIVFHADRGTQYTSDQLHRACDELGVDQSMGRTGVCFDNAMSESFWATLKTEFYQRHTWPTRARPAPASRNGSKSSTTGADSTHRSAT